MPAPLPADTLLDVAVVRIGAALWGATRGGVRRMPNRELRAIEFDGRRHAHIVGHDRVVDFGERSEFTLIEFGQVNIDRFEHVSGGAPARPKAGELYTSARYLNDVSFTYARGGGGSVIVRYPSALVMWTEVRGADKGEAELAVALEPRIAGTDLDLPPYDVQVLAPGTGLTLWDRLPQTNLMNVWYPDTATGQILEDKKSARNLQLGSAAGADTNDPTWGTAPAALRYVSDDWAAGDPVDDALSSYTFIVVLRRRVVPTTTTYYFGYRALGLGMATVDYGGGLHPYRFYLSNAGSPQAHDTGNAKPDENTWGVIYFTRDGGTGQGGCFRNNTQLIAPGTALAAIDTASPRRICFGSNAETVGGSLDDDIGAVIRYGRSISLTGVDNERVTIQNILRDYYPALPVGA
jgi:hypothetical protein